MLIQLPRENLSRWGNGKCNTRRWALSAAPNRAAGQLCLPNITAEDERRCKYSNCLWNNTHFPQKHWQKLFSYLSAQIMLRQDTDKQQNPASKVAQALWICATLEPKCTLLMSKSPQTINTQVTVYLSHVAKIQLHGLLPHFKWN